MSSPLQEKHHLNIPYQRSLRSPPSLYEHSDTSPETAQKVHAANMDRIGHVFGRRPDRNTDANTNGSKGS